MLNKWRDDLLIFLFKEDDMNGHDFSIFLRDV
jgi:hypothetical protein